MNTESIAPGKGVLMPPVKVDAAKVKTFENAIAFDRWLSVHHHEEDAMRLLLAFHESEPGQALRKTVPAAQPVETAISTAINPYTAECR